MLHSDDPSPQNVIRFSEAFEQFYRTIEPRWQELEAARNDAFSAYEKNDFRQKQQDEWYAVTDALDSARISAWGQFRSMLESGQLVACIRDPDKGVILELDPKAWAGPQGLGPRCSIDDLFALMIQSSPAHWPQSAASCAQCFS
jgi:hypothetical protein